MSLHRKFSSKRQKWIKKKNLDQPPNKPSIGSSLKKNHLEATPPPPTSPNKYLQPVHRMRQTD